MDLLNTVEKQVLPTPTYKYITREDEAREALSVLDRYNILEVDTEGTALDPYSCETTLIQIGVPGMAYVFDVRDKLPDININGKLFKEILQDKSKLKLLQNANYDTKVLKVQYGYHIENIYDTMLAEQLMTLGIQFRGFSLAVLVDKYLHMTMEKEIRGTFSDYYAEFKPEQLQYAASDVCTLDVIRNMQWKRIAKYGLEEALDLEMQFIKPLAEMELNGIELDVVKWRVIMGDAKKEAVALKQNIEDSLRCTQDQTTLFGVSSINIDSPKQLLASLNKLGIKMEKTDEEALSRYKGHKTIDAILKYRKLNKLVTTYGEAVVNRINPKTGRLHTRFNQMVQTGRMSSNSPNLQNIPGKQKFRSCFVAGKGKVLITDDMSGAELRIMGDMSEEPNFIKAYNEGLDLHTLNASNIYNVAYDKVETFQRKASKAVTFGLCYGMSPVGLSKRLKISKRKAEDIINAYFDANDRLSKWLNKAEKSAVKNGYSESVSGRKRFYNVPAYDDSDRKRIISSIGRKGKNAPIQGCLVYGSNISGLGSIGKYVNKNIVLETGFGVDVARGVFSGEKDTYNLRTTNGSVLGITSEHKLPIVTNSNSYIEDKCVGDLELGSDMLLVPLKTIDGAPTNISGYTYKKSHWRSTYTSYSYPEVMNTDLSFVIGCLIGDGNYSRHDLFNFVCPNNQQELGVKYSECINNIFGYITKVSITHKNDCNREDLPVYNVFSVVLRGFLKHIGLDYKIHHNKSIPNCFYTESLVNKGALLNGLFSTDGGMTKESGPNYTTVSKELGEGVHNLLFTLGINSNLKISTENNKTVYRLQIPKRFNKKFRDLIGFSVNYKSSLLDLNCCAPKFGDDSIVPTFIPKMIEKTLRKSKTFYNDFSINEKAHLRRFKLGKCSFTSWRKFYAFLPECSEKQFLSKFLDFDFCKICSIEYRGKEPTYDIMCNNIHYFIANGVVVHNSNADTIKKAMVFCVDRLEGLKYEAKLLLTVHDEIIIECPEDKKDEIATLVSASLVDGFGYYFKKIPMVADAVIGPCWIKANCEECGHNEMEFVKDDKYGTKLVCKKCQFCQD